jgi:putative hydrolase of the HAD superfamily
MMRSPAEVLLFRIFTTDATSHVFIDADDTLWHDGKYFRELRRALFAAAEAEGVNRDVVESVLRHQTSNLGPGEAGFARWIRRTAMEAKLGAESLSRIEASVATFLEHPVEVLPFAEETVRLFGGRYTRVLLTKGIESEQRRKLALSGMADAFESVVVVQKKNATALASLYRDYGVTGACSIMIGNSLVHDIEPAVENGSSAIWLDHESNEHGRNASVPIGVLRVETWEPVFGAMRATLRQGAQ